ncbi:possible NADPH dehydrogenase [Weissella oryzae SG25]|uniref:Possible NADPH dehydrogenase n=1 Tax=Weissella oryzae (strain DSM 25784 / JCM 18191 / LMG 30913 / SG25) TaxID=1329250 RepID=A0A069CTI8_WEIOS|nr:NADH-dependent flavin oxidoreductase [Weissella oryzae]GAK30568.1 possible NADPH dehydrogenase [Weissella oryzae SG25]
MGYQFLQPFTLANGRQVKNHIIMPPTTLRSSFATGEVTEAELRYYQLRSAGPGMVITEMAYVSAPAQSYTGQIGADSDDKIPGLKRLAQTIQNQGALAILQLSFGGRIADPAAVPHEDVLGPSNLVSHQAGMAVPRAMTENEILDSILAFGQATRRAYEAGFDGVEIHGANMYLLQQFFSAHANDRDDEWGGDENARMRYGLAVLDEVIKIRNQYADTDFIIGYRQSPEESTPVGIRHPAALRMAQEIIKRPIAYFHLSLKDAFQSPFMDREDSEPLYAKYLHLLGDIPLIVAGLLRTPAQVEQLVTAGVAGAALGRELIVEPNWVQKVVTADEKGLHYALSPSDMNLLAIPAPLQEWLLTRFKKGLVVSTDAAFNLEEPWKYYRE